MNKLNPIYIMLLLFVIMLLSFQFLNQAQFDLEKSNKNLVAFKQSVHEYNSLLKNVSNKDVVIEELELILQEPSFIKANIESKIESNKAFIKMVTSNKRVMQNFVNRLINKNMKISRLEATQGYIVVEVKL